MAVTFTWPLVADPVFPTVKVTEFPVMETDSFEIKAPPLLFNRVPLFDTLNVNFTDLRI